MILSWSASHNMDLSVNFHQTLERLIRALYQWKLIDRCSTAHSLSRQQGGKDEKLLLLRIRSSSSPLFYQTFSGQVQPISLTKFVIYFVHHNSQTMKTMCWNEMDIVSRGIIINQLFSWSSVWTICMGMHRSNWSCLEMSLCLFQVGLFGEEEWKFCEAVPPSSGICSVHKGETKVCISFEDWETPYELFHLPPLCPTLIRPTHSTQPTTQ